MSRSSDPVDPLLRRRTLRHRPPPPLASRTGLKDLTNSILSGESAVKASDYSPALKRLSEVAVSVNAVENHHERRQALRQKRPRFSLKPTFSQPDVSLESTFDSKKYKNPEEYFLLYERNENPKRELEKQMGMLDGDKQNPSSITRAIDQDKLQESVACAEHGFDVAESTAKNLNAPSQSEQLHSSPVEEHPRDPLSEHLDVGLEKQNEIMQEHCRVSSDKPTKANTRSKGKPKNKKASKRQSVACHGTAWESGVRRSTRIKTRPLEYWKGERLLIGRIHNSLPTVIGMKYASPGKREGSLKVKSFVEDKRKVLVDLVSYH